MTAPAVAIVEPVAGTWHEAHVAIATAALEQLRVTGQDVDAERIASKAPSACAAIDRHLELLTLAGRVTYRTGGVTVVTYAPGDAPADVIEAAVQLTTELYRRKDAAFGVLNAWSPTGEALRISGDHLAGVRSLLAPHREGLGVA